MKKIIDQITGLFLPIINYLTAASILKSVLILLANFGVLSKESGLYLVFYAVSDGFFYFLPFFLALTASKQWKTNPFLSLLIPVAMLYPDLVAILENNQSLSFLGLTIQPSVYHSSVIPVLLAIGLLYFVEKPCDKFLPQSLKGFLKPLICCLIVLPVTFLVFGPLGSLIGTGLTKIFTVLYNLSPVIAGCFMGFVIQPMVFLGAHWSIVPVAITNIATNGYDMIMPLLGGAVYGQCGACLAMALIQKEKDAKSLSCQAALSCALGVTEPGLFGITIRHPRAMLSACIAGAVGGGIAGFAGCQCISFAFPSFVTCVAYAGKGFIMFLVSMIVALPIAFFLTLMQKKYLVETPSNEKTQKTEEKNERES
jgi:PTS system beta-glucosides-specific IIC component